MYNRNRKIVRLSQLALLMSILLVMSFTPLGYLRTPILSISFLTVPVAIGALLLGPGAGAFLGLVFGLTSFADAFTGGGMKAVMLTIDPVACFVTTVGARVLCGWLCGLCYLPVRKLLGTKLPGYFLGAAVCPLMNTVLFMGFLMLFYYGSDYVQGLTQTFGISNPVLLVLAMVGLQGLAELLICTILAGFVSHTVAKIFR